MNGEQRHRDAFSAADAAWLHMDRPTNLMVINSILLFDEPLDWERLTGVVRERLVERYPRFRERVREGLPGSGGPRWEEDRDFDLGRHLHRRGLPAPGDRDALRRLAADLASMPLDREKPLWDMYLIDGPAPGCAMIVRMHHCIADGIALAQVMLSLTDISPDAHPPPNGRAGEGIARALSGSRGSRGPARNLGPLRPLGALGAHGLALARGGLRASREGLAVATHPRRALELAGDALADGRSLAKLLLLPADSQSMLKDTRMGTARALAWTARPLSLERVKAVAHAQEATVNDVLLACVSGALRDHLAARGEQPHEVRTLVPVNLRPLDEPVPRELGNRFGLVYLTLPVDLASRRERLRELKARMDAIKRSPEGPVSYAVLEAVGMTPRALESRVVDLFTAKASAVMTNVPGPREPVYLAGSPLRAVIVWAPTAGSVAVSVSIFSYRGEVTIGLLTHARLLPDPETIVARVPREMAALERLAPAARAFPRRAGS